MDLRFYQYSDFDISGTAYGDTSEMVNANTWIQYDDTGRALSETVVTPVASRFEAGVFSGTLSALEDEIATDLDNVPGPFVGDVTWDFRWDLSIAAGGSFLISTDESIQVPPPGALAFAGLGLGCVGWMRSRFA